MTTRLVDWAVTACTSVDGPHARDRLVERLAGGEPHLRRSERTSAMPPSMADVVHRYARVAAVVNRFYAELHGGDRRVVFPAEEVRAAFSRG